MKHSKRYKFIFNTWSSRSFKSDELEFDSLKELNKTIALYDEIYNTTEPSKDLFGDEKIWGYAAVDFESEKILKYGGRGLYNINNKHFSILAQKDYFFRGEDEVPKNYKWDDGEYDGWLQFRWGDGKNAINYVERPKSKKKTVEEIKETETNEFDELQEEFDKSYIKEKIKEKIDRW